MLLQNGVANSLRKKANEHAMTGDAPGWVAAERHPTLPDVEKDESADTSGASDGVGALAESVKRSGWAASEAGRRDRWERMDDALRARIVLEYSIARDQRCAVRVAPGCCGAPAVQLSFVHPSHKSHLSTRCLSPPLVSIVMSPPACIGRCSRMCLRQWFVARPSLLNGLVSP